MPFLPPLKQSGFKLEYANSCLVLSDLLSAQILAASTVISILINYLLGKALMEGGLAKVETHRLCPIHLRVVSILMSSG